MSLPIPEVPTLFMKPASSLADPWPAPTVLPKITQRDNTGDYESEMVIVIGRDAKDVPESEALDYVLGYTAANDVSSRTFQINQSQWSFSKGFDGACPIGMLSELTGYTHELLVNSVSQALFLFLLLLFPMPANFKSAVLRMGT
jgi:2-keto-4-pentenoate hydratase/2-oxohepta-3-ene-1,7-dioic acid hydratase in catechol pathway